MNVRTPIFKAAFLFFSPKDGDLSYSAGNCGFSAATYEEQKLGFP
jgi:hypothetical protein